MGRKKGYVPFAPWEARKPDEKGYTRVAASLLYSDAVMNLNHAAFRVFVYMRQHSVGKPEFEFPYSRFKKFMSKGGFAKAVDELVAVGLIEVAENNAHRQKPNVYRFSAKWEYQSAPSPPCHPEPRRPAAALPPSSPLVHSFCRCGGEIIPFLRA